jgi:phosphonate transport system ATP-binding protein
MLKVENISKKFDTVEVLKNVSFEVVPGEFLVVLGPSGSGKTTLLRSINGLVNPDRGTIYLKEEKITDKKRLAELRRHFGMIFQHYNLVENLSVINNVLTGALTSMNHLLSLFYLFPNKQKIRALQCLKRVELLEKAYERTGDLSGGQKQRVGIARAIMQNPYVILADEPIANLDPMIAYNIMMLLKDICRNDGISIICNLHQVDFALQFADRIICLVNGEIILEEQAAELSSEIIYQAYQGKSQGMFFKEASNEDITLKIPKN